MANQFVVGHAHCPVCGACFLHPSQLHTCPAPVSTEVLALFLMESCREYAKPVSARRHRKELTTGPTSPNVNEGV